MDILRVVVPVCLLPCLVSLQPLDMNKVNYFVVSNEERRTTSAQMTFDARLTCLVLSQHSTAIAGYVVIMFRVGKVTVTCVNKCH